MERLAIRIHDDDAVSPVIGVILMVAITVILAAVIASFVIGLGDQQEPAPTPQFDLEQNENWQLNYTKQGGNDFEVTDAEIQAEFTVRNTSNGDEGEFDFNIEDINTTDDKDTAVTLDDSGATTGTTDYDMVYNVSNMKNGEMTAGDEINFGVTKTTGGAVQSNENIEISEWDVELLWAPPGEDSEVIYSSTS